MTTTRIFLTGAGRAITAPVGFSVTVLLFGPVVALLRRDWQAALIFSVVQAMLLTLGMTFLFAIFSFAFLPAVYNRTFIARHIFDGYGMTTDDANKTLPLCLKRLEPLPLYGDEPKAFAVSCGVIIAAFTLAAIGRAIFA